MRRKPGTLLPLEVDLLDTATAMRARGEPEFHGYLIAKEMKDRGRYDRLTAHGTLYKALDRLQTGGLLSSRWEPPEPAEREGRPRRRLYQVTVQGAAALAAAHAGVPFAGAPAFAAGQQP